jgi:hypothetical protein
MPKASRKYATSTIHFRSFSSALRDIGALLHPLSERDLERFCPCDLALAVHVDTVVRRAVELVVEPFFLYAVVDLFRLSLHSEYLFDARFGIDLTFGHDIFAVLVCFVPVPADICSDEIVERLDEVDGRWLTARSVSLDFEFVAKRLVERALREK